MMNPSSMSLLSNPGLVLDLFKVRCRRSPVMSGGGKEKLEMQTDFFRDHR